MKKRKSPPRPWRKTVRMLCGTLLFASFSPCIGTVAAQDVREIVSRAIEREIQGTDVPAEYTYTYKQIRYSLDREGQRKQPQSKTYEVTVLYGAKVQRLIAKDGQPLPAAEEAKEKARFEEEVAKLAIRPVAERERLQQETSRKTAKEREFLRAIPASYDLRLVGEEKLEGRDAWIIEAIPMKKPKTKVGGPKGNLLRLYGKLWVDKKEFQWIRVEAEARETLSYGLFLARIYPGSKVTFENTHVNDEIWAPKRIEGRFTARFLGVKRFNLEDVTEFFDYRKFRVNARILTPEAEPSEENPGRANHEN